MAYPKRTSIRDLEGPWRYESELPSLGWDVTDDRVYALRANNPSPEKKRTNPGPEALALLGLSLYPVFAGQDGTDTQGCFGTWKTGYYSWPLWRKPASPHAVKSLLAHASGCAVASKRHVWYRSWGVSTVFRSPIRPKRSGWLWHIRATGDCVAVTLSVDRKKSMRAKAAHRPPSLAFPEAGGANKLTDPSLLSELRQCHRSAGIRSWRLR